MVFLKNKSKGLLSIILPLILLSLFNNCGDVTFQTDEAGLLQQLSTNASVTINNNDQFTRNRDVILNIHSDRATEMMVSNSTQDTVWEPYQQIKAWQLSRLNTTATVYVRFRDKGIASEWEQDEIIHDLLTLMF